jgi:hypothetical protein
VQIRKRALVLPGRLGGNMSRNLSALLVVATVCAVLLVPAASSQKPSSSPAGQQSSPAGQQSSPAGQQSSQSSPPGQQSPSNVVAPSVSGSAVAGQTLTASTGSWSGSGIKYAYQWRRCGNGCVSVAGATGSSYLLGAPDVGYTLEVVVTASNNNGSASATSSPTGVVAPAPAPAPVSAPVNTALPTTSGSVVVGQLLSTSAGAWSGSPTSYAYQWRHCDSSGGACVNVSGATSTSYLLSSGDVGFTIRVAVTAKNSVGSTTATSAQTAVVAASTSSTSGYPASFFGGPAGTNIVLPPNGGYPARGAWIGEASANGLTQVQSREQYFGRKFNIYAYYASNRCDPWPTTLAQAASAGYIPMISWYPNPYYADQIINGLADSCIKSFGNAVANQSAKVFVRPYWEFNGGWQPFSKNSDGTRATAAQEKQMWQHTIDVLRTTGFFSKASVVWSVNEGYYNNGDAWNNPTPYPGDNYVDWVASGSYNWDSSTAWCGLHAGWCSFAEAVTHGRYAPTYTPIGVEASFRGKKPYLVGESGSIEDPNTAGRKGQWMVDMGNYAKTYMPGLYAIVYFDTAYNGSSWNLDTSTSSMNGFKSFANTPYFDIPNH